MSSKLQRSVVLITGSDSQRFGTGFIFHRDHLHTFILTCTHVIDDVGGKQSVKAGTIAAKVVASGSSDGLDLTVLRVKDFFDRPVLTLSSSAENGTRVTIFGYHQSSRSTVIRKVQGVLDEQSWIAPKTRRMSLSRTWDIKVNDDHKLESGYSGSPVVDETSGEVLGVIMQKMGDGEKGFAISIEALEKIWPDMPAHLLHNKATEEGNIVTTHFGWLMLLLSIAVIIVIASIATIFLWNLRGEDVSTQATATAQSDATQTAIAGNMPTEEFTVESTQESIAKPTDEPTIEPTEEATSEPTTEVPTTVEPTQEPTVEVVSTSDTIPVSNFEIGSEMTRQKDGAEMVFVPAGEFMMGSDDSDSDALEDEFPSHSVFLNAFWIDKYEVTIGQYEQCANEQECDTIHLNNPSYTGFYAPDKPMIQVDWNNAKKYCQWVGGDLPSEAQWEKAAKGTDGRLYPWGNTFDGNVVNHCDVGCGQNQIDQESEDGFGLTSPVGHFSEGKSIYGAYDISGNVWEWVDDWYQAYPNSTFQSQNFGQKFKVLRGGSWINNLRSDLRTTRRGLAEPDVENLDFGFRCVVSATIEKITASDNPPPSTTDGEDDEPDTPYPLAGRLAIPLVIGGGYRVYLADTDGNQLEVLGSARQPDFTQDGNKLIVDGFGPQDKLRVWDRENLPPFQIGDPRLGGHSHPAWSPDGSQVIYDDDTLGCQGYCLYIRDLVSSDGGGQIVQATGPIEDANPLYPLWTTNNRFIFKGCNTWAGAPGNCGIWMMRNIGGQPEKISENIGIPSDVFNDTVVYNFEGDVFKLDISNLSNSMQLTFDPANDGLATISPDGNWVAFLSNRGSTLAVWYVGINGGEPQKMFDINPAWGTLDANGWFDEKLAWGK